MGDSRPTRRETVSELGELVLIDRITARIGAPRPGELWAGDDAALVKTGGAGLLVSTDALVAGVDFDLAYASGQDIGWKSLAVSLSDIAAMGGSPDHAFVALTLPPETPVTTVDGIVEGLVEVARRWDVGLAGGDVGSGPVVALSVTVTGEPPPPGPVLRGGARVGHAICVTGSLGGAAGGLLALQRADTRTVEAKLDGLAARQLRPQPRVDEGMRLAELGATAMIDLSDGLAVDLGHLTDASGVGCRIDPGAIPVDPDLGALGMAEGRRLELAIIGGEDYELLFTIEESEVDAARASLAAMGTNVTRIGAIMPGDRTIGEDSLDDWRQRGWEHLRSR